MLREACRQGRVWADALPQPPVVAVNLSALQFKRGDVLALVREALRASGLPAHLLELELTESILLQDVDSTIATLQGLKALGVKLSIVKAIVQLGHNLQLTVIAEGVETPAQRQVLTDIGCDEAQDYLIGRPATADACQALLMQT